MNTAGPWGGHTQQCDTDAENGTHWITTQLDSHGWHSQVSMINYQINLNMIIQKYDIHHECHGTLGDIHNNGTLMMRNEKHGIISKLADFPQMMQLARTSGIRHY